MRSSNTRSRSSMIGAVLFYVLRPLSRYLTSLSSDASSGIFHPALVNGKKVCDGDAVPTFGLTQCQPNPLDQQSSATEESDGEKADEKSPSSARVQLSPDLIDEAAAAQIEEPLSVKDTKGEGINDHRQDHVEDPRLNKGEVVNQSMSSMENKEDGYISSAGSISTEQELGLLLKYTQMDGGPGGESTVPVQKATPSFREKMQEQVHVPRVETATLSDSRDDETVCWDEQIAEGTPGREKSEPMFTSPRFDTQDQWNDVHVNWHFSAGPGLVEEVHCPLWPLPPMSYYPVLEPRGPLEVEWRIWQERQDWPRAAAANSLSLPFAEASVDFTVMSYNILADDLLVANLELYTHCPLDVLDWSYRCTLLLEEILKWAPDILCLQEVQESHYRSHFHPVLSQRGYTCVYKQRTGSKTDGCATCYRTSCFSEVSVTLLEYFRPDVKVLDRHNVGIISLLRPVVKCGSKVTGMGPPLCVANTHLLFNPKRGDVKLAQLAVMLAEIDRVVKSCQANGEPCNVVLCGDFNSAPYSPLYQLITTGQLYFQGLPAWTISGQEDLSHRVPCYRLFSPLWPSCLGISHNCQYQAQDQVKSLSRTPDLGKRRYTHHFLLQRRFTAAACIRPVDLELIAGVTDNTPDAARDHHQRLYSESFGSSLCHGLDLESVYQHILPGSAGPEVTTLHSQVGATVDYIFYNPKLTSTSDGKAASTATRTGLRLVGSLSLLSEDTLWSLKGLPNYMFPSDHLSLLAKFQMDLNAA